MKSNLKSFGNILKQEGTSRYERYLPALNPENVLIDDRKLQDFIIYAQRYSKNLLFIDTDAAQVDLKESWETFFKNDILLLIANIATKNVQEIKSSFDVLYRRFLDETTDANFDELAGFVFSRFIKINGWYYSASSDSSLKQDLTLYIQSYLQKELETLKEIIFHSRNQGDVDYRAEDFKKDFFSNKDIRQVNELLQKDNVWEIKDKENTALREHIFGGENNEEKLYNASLALNRVFDAVFHTTETIINSCRSYFDDTVHAQQQQHSPHVALLIAFIRLYGHVQEELNKIPKKHLDYYYKQVLQIKEKEAIPDQAFVVFDLAKGFETAMVKKGAAFSAGKDARNTELVYETDDDIVVNKAQVSSLHTLFIDKDDQNQNLNYFTDTILKGAAPAPASKETSSWKIFGEPKQGAIAEIGFAISSTQFYLAKGERNVMLSVELEDVIDIEEFDTGIIKLLLTGEKGWLNSDHADSGINIKWLKKTGDRTIELNFSISIAQELAIIAFDPKLHSGNFITSAPVLQCILKYPVADPAAANQAPTDEFRNKIALLNILQQVKIAQASIKVQVGSINTQISFDGVKDLILQNHESILDNKKPFYPFTAIPKAGSSFYIGCKDLFYKEIQNLSVNIEWMLPDNFGNHYAKYFPPYDSNKFKASLSILKNKYWKKINDVSVIDVDSGDPRFRSIKIDFNKLKLSDAAAEAEKAVPKFDNSKKDGTLKLKLNYPDFGHSIYPQLITSVVMEKASSKLSGVDFYKIVKKQLHDSVISIKLPHDLDKRTGPLKVVIYDILEKITNDPQARAMMINGLGEMLRRYNGSNIISKRPGAVQGEEEPVDEEENRKIINDDNFIERVLGFLKKVKLIDKTIHYDEDRQNAEQVIESVKDKINADVDFIMPGDKELITVIMNETNSAINKSVTNVVDQILGLRQKGLPDPTTVAELIKKEFGEANEVINDMIARKIAILLSANEIPPPPYAPLINTISVSYSSVKAFEKGDDQFFHITPFGVSEIEFNKTGEAESAENNDKVATNFILPTSIVINQFASGAMQGMLFIGIRDLVLHQNLTVLVQLAEGTRLTDRKPPPVSWWYLRTNEWVELKKDDLVSDSTYGLQTTGILEFSIPSDANNKTTLFNNGRLFWLCASVAKDTDAFPKLVDIKAQAASVTFKNRNNNPSHLAFPLEAGRINNLVNKQPEIKKVSQPVSSNYGKVQEHDQDYYTRTSERLRHKSRAICTWDYEHLVLENFPSLYKVKCLNNYYAGHHAVGHITVVPISDLTNKNTAGNSALIPKIGYLDLRSIEKLLYAKCSPFVRVHAVNPQLDHVLISCKVKFLTGVDKGYYLQQLNEDLINFLTPWASGDAEAVSFSAKLYSSSIINFIDKREYVDYVAELVMQQYTQLENGEKVFCSEAGNSTFLVETQFTTGHSILVSAPKHEIELIE